MSKVTVVITIHNSENYLRECLESVINQTHKNLEILCIDGGSTDKSPDILKRYSKKDDRIIILNDPNTSYGHKINIGIRKATGQYISFLEADDMYTANMIEKLLDVIEKYHPDFVDGDFAEMYDCGGEHFFYRYEMYPPHYYGHLRKNVNISDRHQIVRYWTGLFDLNFLLENRIFMNESPGASFQDISFRFLTTMLGRTVFHVKDIVYLYRVDNPDSSMYNQNKARTTADEYIFLANELLKRDLNDSSIWKQYYKWKYVDIYFNIWRFKNEAKDTAYNRAMEELYKDLEKLREYDLIDSIWEAEHLLNWSKQEIYTQSEIDNARENEIRDKRKRFSDKLIGKNIVIFGSGKNGDDFLDTMAIPPDKIRCYCDNKKELWGKYKNGKKILSPQESVALYKSDLFFIKCPRYEEEMAIQLKKLGVANDRIIFNPGSKELRIQL